jgi:monoterpene epsilon-lactone hydrolase
MNPSRRHEFLAWAVPRMRGSHELESREVERSRLLERQAKAKGGVPDRLVPRFAKRFSVVTEVLKGAAGEFPSYVVTPRGSDPGRTVVYLHGGGYVSGIDPFHVRYVTRLATALGARVVLPDYPLAPRHTWSDSHDPVADLTERWAADSDALALAGDSAGGGYALAVALTLRDRGGPKPSRLVLHSPWVDLTTSTPETAAFSEDDPWLFLGKISAYADWWAGSTADLGRPEVSPGLGDLAGLPAALMFCGTRDTLAPGCRMLASRAAEAGWDLTYVERPGLIHVYPLLPVIPEASEAWRRTLTFLG